MIHHVNCQKLHSVIPNCISKQTVILEEGWQHLHLTKQRNPLGLKHVGLHLTHQHWIHLCFLILARTTDENRGYNGIHLNRPAELGLLSLVHWHVFVFTVVTKEQGGSTHWTSDLVLNCILYKSEASTSFNGYLFSSFFNDSLQEHSLVLGKEHVFIHYWSWNLTHTYDIFTSTQNEDVRLMARIPLICIHFLRALSNMLLGQMK